MSHQIIHDFRGFRVPVGVKTIALDFDNTCYLYEPCHHFALDSVNRVFQEKYPTRTDFFALYEKAQDEVKKRIPTHAAGHARILYFQSLLEMIGSNQIITDALAFETLYWDSFMTKMQPTAGLLDFLASCKESGTTVVVISDLTAQIQFKKILTLGIAPFVDYVVTSEEAGADKPDSVIFKHMLEKTASSVSDVVMIGDSLEKDIRGAENLGIIAIQIIHEELS